MKLFGIIVGIAGIIGAVFAGLTYCAPPGDPPPPVVQEESPQVGPHPTTPTPKSQPQQPDQHQAPRTSLLEEVRDMCSGQCSNGSFTVLNDGGAVRWMTGALDAQNCPAFQIPDGYLVHAWDGFTKSQVNHSGAMPHLCEATFYRTT
jgi:hypothetical protein